eukprot:GEMP01001154.1.p1 GENE.GEMP01001154.1~~GEMP01001154.1.p1  ORF type:complete len:1304 (+),score=323.21 GEMP01001154.1:91-3912(+)
MDDNADSVKPARSLKKRNRREFEDLEAEERSDDSDIEAEQSQAHGTRGSAVLPREVAELKREMDARSQKGATGARGFGTFLDDLEGRLRQQSQDEMEPEGRALDRADDDLLIPEEEVKSNQSMQRAVSESPAQKQRKMEPQSQDRPEGDFLLPENDVKSNRSARPSAPGSQGQQPRVHPQIDAAHKTLPMESDPRLWRVKCYKNGFEKEYCANLVNKFWHMVQTHGESYLEEIPIYSVFAADAAKGYVYIEAHREIDVRNYIKGIRALGAWNIHLVPTQEMVGVFNMATFLESQNKGGVKAGSWVRIKRGIYKGDIALVVRVFEGSAQMRIKPRANLNNEATGKQPRQEFFNLAMSKTMPHVSVTNARKKVNDIPCFEVNGETYTCESGHIIKTFTRASFNIDIQTTLAEEEAFSNPLAPESYNRAGAQAEEDPDQAARQMYRKSKDALRGGVRQKQFFKGERVRVVSGQLANLLSRVVEVLQNNTLRLEAEYASADWKKLHGLESGQIDLPYDMVEKYFEVGMRVKALAGDHIGETGLVVNVIEKERCCAVLSETVEERGFPVEFKVSSWDLTCTTDKKALEMENFGFTVGDLALGPSKMIAIVTSLGRSTARVLTEQGLIRDWHYKQISLHKKLNDRALGDRERDAEWALDRRGHKICRSFQVTVYATEKRRRMVGTVVHILRETSTGAERVYVHDASTLGEEKFVIALARECESRTASAPTSQYESKRVALEAIGDEERLKAIESEMSLVMPGKKVLTKGRRVQLIAGPYKGLLAEIRDEIDDHYVRLQLLIKPKMMQVHKKNIQFFDLGKQADMLEDLPPKVPPTPLPELEDVADDTRIEHFGMDRGDRGDEDSESNDGGADPWDLRFKLPVPVRKKAEIAWDPTYRKTKILKQAALPAPTPEQLEDEESSHHARSHPSSLAPNNELGLPKAIEAGSPHEDPLEPRFDNELPPPDKLLEILDGTSFDEGANFETSSAVDMTMDELLTNPVTPDVDGDATSVRSDIRSVRTQSIRSVRTTATKKKSIASTMLSTPGSPATLLVPLYCQKGVRVQVNGKSGWITIVLFNKIFVHCDDGKTVKMLCNQASLAPISVNDFVLPLSGLYQNMVGTCKAVDAADTPSPQATVDFEHAEGVRIELALLAKYKWKQYEKDDDAQSDTNSMSSFGSRKSARSPNAPEVRASASSHATIPRTSRVSGVPSLARGSSVASSCSSRRLPRTPSVSSSRVLRVEQSKESTEVSVCSGAPTVLEARSLVGDPMDVVEDDDAVE